MREYRYRVDREGHIFHDGTEIVDPATLRFFLLALRRTSEGGWVALCQGERNWFESDGTPFVVQRLGLTVAGTRLRAVELRLAGDYREPLDPESLQSDGGDLFCRVRMGAFSARFGKIAMQQIAPWLVEGPEGPVLELAERRYLLMPSGATPPP
jgi:hypothetical protein